MVENYDTQLMLGYVEGDLSPQDRARFEQRMADDAALAQLVAQLRADRDALRRLPRDDPPPGLVDQVIQQSERRMLLGEPDAAPSVDDGDEAIRRFRLHRWIAYSGIAAVVMICAGVMIFSLSSPGPATHGPIAASEPFDRNDRKLALAEGEAVTLDEALEEAAKTEDDATPPAEPTLAKADAETPGPTGVAGGYGALAMKKAAKMPSAVVAANEPAPTLDYLGERIEPAGRAIDRTLRVEVNTDDADLTQRDLRAWARDNDAQVVYESEAPAQNLGRARQIADAQPAQQEVTVVLEEAQVPRLLDDLNRRAGQNANVLDGENIAFEQDTQPQTKLGREVRRSVSTTAEASRLAADQRRLEQQTQAGIAFDARSQEAETEAFADAPDDAAEADDAFEWYGVLESQLPLAQRTPLAELRREPVLRLQVLINEAAPPTSEINAEPEASTAPAEVMEPED